MSDIQRIFDLKGLSRLEQGPLFDKLEKQLKQYVANAQQQQALQNAMQKPLN